MSLRSAVSISLFLWAVSPLGCAVEATDLPNLDDESGTAGVSVGGSSGNPAPTTTMGGKSPTAGNGAFGGTSSSAGKGGATSAAGKSGEGGMASAGKGGMSMAGTPSSGGSSAGSGGSSAGSGGSSAGSGGSSAGSGSVGECGALRTWMPMTSMQIKAGEVIQWKGKRYKANNAIDWTNPECAPDAPLEWCAGWFTADGSC